MKLKPLALLSLAVFSTTSIAAIDQASGVDQRVNYAELTKYGPWDDRNYLLTKEDLDVIPENDQYLANVPVFFKVFKRKELPQLGDLYPRSTLQHFQMLHGGLIVDGIWYKEALGIGYHKENNKPGKFQGVDVKEIRGGAGIADTETAFEVGVAGNETSVECNPVDNTKCVAGSNTSNGQTMYYSTDSGVTWTKSQENAGSCCDPAVDYSSDGSIVYQADLSGPSIGVRWTRSLDQGVTWEPMKVVTSSGSDKEWIHVDRSNSSPHKDNVYLTWHDSNVMQFARSTDMGQTMSTPLSFSSDPVGIGSDITTDSAGNIYYVYASTASGGGIRLLKSTDGGVNFAASTQIAPINGRFDFPIPSMETREAFIYAAVDVDSQDHIYVTFTDEADDSAGGGTGSAAQNHGVVKVAKSTDGGATWNLLPYPHDTSDSIASNPVDRYHPWLMVDEFDNVHIAFYDTRHYNDRSGVDFYYNVSTDGGATWQGEQRVTNVSSDNLNDGQEWGDYNSISVVMDKIVMSWTDNRTSKVGMAGTIGNAFASPTFNVEAAPSSFEVCANDTGMSSTLDFTQIQSYPGTITLSVDSAPGYVTNTAFSSNGQPAPFTSNFTFDVDATGSTGMGVISVLASGNDNGDVIEKTVDINVTYGATIAGASTLTAPADAATNVAAQPSFSWTADANATSYLIEVATDDQFNNIVISETVDTNSYAASMDLQTSTDHYWRVSSINPCGSAVSSVFSFTTTVAPGDCPIGMEQYDIYSYTFNTPLDLIYKHGFESGPGITGGQADPQGWTVSAAAGLENWSLQAVGDAGSHAFQADDLANINDTSVVSPVMSLPTGVGPLTLRFWNSQTIEDQTSGAACFDAGQLQISVDGGAMTQVTNADIINNDYNGPISSAWENPAGGQNGWCGDPLAATVFSVNADNNAGSDVQYAFRMTSDSSVGRPEGWVIDNVRITGCRAPSE